ncbi:hypothetical protein FLO80_10445 [Aquicoccus porphyridii]|uniref:Uncharacterized protein n=2 Tax=Aquicoccus porphyridii TaxID=1852029 RepID=A0A5A9ZFT1_9RHOB|nr:hypothetical protein FLO80_10445 [Aquicoccus porphyridii]
MMGISHLLESFDTANSERSQVISLTEVGLEENRLEAFEEGYKAGWDDAIKSQSDDKTQISQDFAQNLQQISFTYHEAQAEILKSLKPVLEEVAGVLLPDIARSNFGAHLLSEVTKLTDAATRHDIEIVVCPANIAALESILSQRDMSPIKLSSEDNLGEGQAYIRLNGIERHIDLDAAMNGIRAAIDGYYQQLETEAMKETGNAG